MNKPNIFSKLNKSTIIKMVIIAVLIIAIEILSGFLIFNNFKARTYGVTYAEYDRQISAVSERIAGKLGDELNNLSESGAQAAFKAALEEESAFSDYVLFTEAGRGRIVGDGWLIDGNLNDYGIDYTNTEKTTIDGGVYVFTASRLGESAYYVGALVDFAAQQNEITSLLDNTVALIVIASIFVLAAFVFYAYWAGGYQRKGRFDYKFTLDTKGNVVRSNGKFKEEFADLGYIGTDFKSFKRKTYNAIKLKGVSGEKLLISRSDIINSSGYVKVAASTIGNADSLGDLDEESNELTANGKAKASLSQTFNDFIKRGKRTLLGIIHISNLNQISTLFGKPMALNIQKIVMTKAKEKFLYVYELDFGQIGVVFPDGKRLDNLLSDMPGILMYVSQPINMEDNLFTVELKSGFALCDANMEVLNFEYGMKAAEAAYQRIVDTAIADYIVYHESQKKLYTKYFITYDIKQMLQEGAFEMEYQPQYNIDEDRIDGFEALFRVKKSWNVNVDTFSFITYAERTGAMVQLGDFIFDTGMRFAKQLEEKNISISLNVSPVQLMQAGFTENFLRIYKKYGLKPGSICVEITESFLMTNFQETIKKLEILKSNGIYTHLDDFGTEYSSLLYIKKLPISTIKIDKEFIKDVLKNKESQAVIKFITDIAALLHFTTICEGVETTDEFDMLNYLGCDTIQGWLIGKSMKPEDALAIADNFNHTQIAAKKAK